MSMNSKKLNYFILASSSAWGRKEQKWPTVKLACEDPLSIAIFIFLVHTEPNPLLCKQVSGWTHNSLQQGSFCNFSESQAGKGVALGTYFQPLQPHQSTWICKCLGVCNSSGTPTILWYALCKAKWLPLSMHVVVRHCCYCWCWVS